MILDTEHLQIGSLLFEGIDQIDITGPFEVLSRLPNSTYRIYGTTLSPVRDVQGFRLMADALLSDAPQLDVLHVPGGGGQEALMDNEEMLGWLRQQAGGARRVFSVCTGALICGAAGLLKGRRVNALVPMIHVAADQRRYPYGSLVFLPAASGFKMKSGQVLDGYFWVSDTGGKVIGDHFDLFVGDESIYLNFMHRDIQLTYSTTIYPIPALSKNIDPRNDAGLAAILRSQDLLKDKSDPLDKEKLAEALLLFQQANPHIPVAEYGDPDAATTLWFLTQAAMKTLEGEKYGAK